MKHNYIIISEEKVTIDLDIKKIIKNISNKDLDIIKYDYQETSIDFVLEELNTYNFLSNCKLIIFENSSFLSSTADKSLKDLKKYLNNPSDNYLIMINNSISDKKEIKELLSSDIELLNNNISSEQLVLNNLEDLEMDRSTINYFCNYCLNNNEKILNELLKLKNYKFDEENKKITKEDINNIVTRDYDDDIFDLVNAIMKKDKDKAFKLYYRLIQKEKDTVGIIGSLASSIRNLYSVKVLQDKKYKQLDISNILGIKPYAVSVAIENCNNYSSKKLLYLLNTLSDMDFKTKSGNGNANILFEMFLLSL